MSLAQQLGETKGLIQPMLALFTLGTIADLAPLTGVNRRWVKRGLQHLPKSHLAGVQALIQVGGVQARGEGAEGAGGAGEKIPNSKSLKPEDIGFRLGPRINAIGRIGNPQTVIELLTTDDMGVALELAMQCEQVNASRQEMCQQIEQEAIATPVNSLLVERIPRLLCVRQICLVNRNNIPKLQIHETLELNVQSRVCVSHPHKYR